ncbi:MAG: hypothetical protein WAM60_13470 [Candidatus Promineifilaceae bacterium]
MRNIKRVIGITAVLVIALMAVGATAVLASPLVQSEDPEQVDPEAETTESVGSCGVGYELMDQIIDRDALDAVTADALGITVEELQAAKDSGQRLSDLAVANDVTVEEVHAAVEAARAEMVQQAVDDGLITAEQADCILSHVGGPCNGGHHHGPRGPQNGNAAPPTDNTTNTAASNA